MHRHITRSLPVLALALAALVGCSSDKRNMTFGEFKQLPEAEKKEFAKEISAEEMTAIMRAGVSNAFKDTTTLNNKTLQELIDEGRAMGEGQEKE